MTFIDRLIPKSAPTQEHNHPSTMDRALDLQPYSPNMYDTAVLKQIKKEGILASLLLTHE